MAGGVSHTIAVLVKGHNALTSSLVKAEGSLASFRKTAEATALSINSKLAVSDIDTSAISQASSALTGMGTKALVTGGVMAAGLGVAVHAAAKFQSAMAEVSTLVDNSTTDMDALTGTVRGLSKEFGQMPVDTAKALYTTISAGFSNAADASVLLAGAMKLSRGGLADLGVSIDGLTSIMNSYGLSADQVTNVSDRMFVAMKAGKTTIGELSSSLGKVTPLASSAGVAIDDILAATSALTLGGLNTAEAVTALRGTLSAVIKPTAEATKLAESLGIEFSASAVKSMGLQKWLAQVAEKSGGSQEVLGKLFGQVEALSGVLALTGNQAGSFASILEQIGKATGATDEAFRKVNETASAAFDRARANAAVLLESIGSALMPVVSRLADAFAWLAGKLSGFAEAHPLLAKLGVVLAAVTAGVLLLGGAALVMGGQIVTAMAAINISTGGLLLAVGALVTGITLLVMTFTSGSDDMAESTGILATAWGYLKAAFYAVATPVAYGVGFLVGVLTNAWSTVATYTAEVWPLIQQVVTGAWNAVMTLLGPALNVLSAWFTTAWTSIKIVVTAVWDAIGLTISTIWNGVYNTIAAVWNLISGLFKASLQVLTGDWSGAWQTIENTFAAVWENIKGIFQGWWTWFTGLGDIFTNAGTGLISAFWEGITSAWEGLKAGFSDLLQGLRDLLPFSDAAAGPLSELTKSGRSLLPTFASGIAQTSDVPAGVVSKSLSRIALDAPAMPAMPSVNLQPPRIPPLQLEAQGAQAAPAPASAAAEGSSNGVVFERGAIVVTVTGASALDDLEERLTEIFSRASLRLGVSHG